MLSRSEVIHQAQGLAVFRLKIRYDDAMIEGVAKCDLVSGSRRSVKLRARFGHGIKAILNFDDYGGEWEVIECITVMLTQMRCALSTGNSKAAVSVAKE